MADRTRRRTSRAEQAADPADVRAVGYGPDDVVQVPERYADLPVHKENSGRADRWNDRLAEPEPSSVYVVDDRYLYATDKAGRVTHAEGWLGWLPSKDNDERRNLEAQRGAGEPDRQRTDDGGHLFATAFDGPCEAIKSHRAVAEPEPGGERKRQLAASGGELAGAAGGRHPGARQHRRPVSRRELAAAVRPLGCRPQRRQAVAAAYLQGDQAAVKPGT